MTEYPMHVELWECEDCGCQYPVVPYFRAAAPHGPDKSCRSKRWKRIDEGAEHDRER